MGASVPAALAVVVLATQIVIEKPQEPGDPPRPVGRYYGEPLRVDLSSIWFMGETYQDKHVRTRGRLDPLEMNRYYLLKDGSAQALIIPVPELVTELDKRVGQEIELRGIVRRLRPKEYVGRDKTDLDLVEHPDLPVLPPPSPALPPFSITVLGFAERESFTRGAGGTSPAVGSAAALLSDPPPPGKRQRIVLVGRFRGRNLFGDLPAATQRRPADWVLKDGGTALWVTGTAPRGKGWSLDPDYKADSDRWLEVTGTAEVVGGVLYVNASKLQLVKPRRQASSEQDP